MKYGRKTICSLIGLMCFQSTLAPALAEPPIIEKLKQLGARQGHPPVTKKDRAIEELAANLDWLEHELDAWGTVVPKTPDVWGEARLTQFRHEVEKQLANKIGDFDASQINGAQIVSDQAFLAAALSMNIAPNLGTGVTPVPRPTVTATVAGGTAGFPAGANATVPEAKVVISGETVGSLFGTTGNIGDKITLEQTESLDQLRAYLDHLNALRRTNEGDDASDAPGYTLNLVRIPISILPGTHSRKGYGAEITLTAMPQLGPDLLPFSFRDFVINDLVDQLAIPYTRYINDSPIDGRQKLQTFIDLEELNRNLFEARTSLIQLAREFTCDPSNEALCIQFAQAQSLLFRDNQFDVAAIEALPATQLSSELDKLLAAIRLESSEIANQIVVASSPEIVSSINTLDTQMQLQAGAFAPNIFQSDSSSNPQPNLEFQPDTMRRVPEAALRTWLDQKTGAATAPTMPSPPPMIQPEARIPTSRARQTSLVAHQMDAAQMQAASEYNRTFEFLSNTNSNAAKFSEAAKLIGDITVKLNQLGTKLQTSYIPTSQGRRSTLPFPSTHLEIVYGLHGLGHLATTAFQAFERDIVNKQIIHITDVQALMRSELMAACDLMALDVMQPVWTAESTGERYLYDAVRRGDTDAIAEVRNQFLSYVGPHAEHFHTAYFAWAVYVESILLNERLIEDMRQTVSPYGGSMAPPCWLAFFGPNPSEDARAAYAEYVKVRWPVRVFTVDPAILEQNISDVSNVYREMQLAIALSVAGGEVSASAALNTLRKIQRDMATVELNRTVVGFSHGDDTFGWRFYPRFQTPPVEGNLTVFFRDLVAGGPTDEQLERSKTLEPGIRECIALVLMPSFVSNVQFDSRGNWFKLTRPGHTAQSISENVEYSRSIEAMRNNAMQCVQCAHLYRPGELDRLLRRVDQLDRELPLQTLSCQVPIENTLGGFEIFTSGTRELAPELLGWYGAPGYDPVNGATFFLAGDNFSIHQTSVIAGNREIQVEKMLSRQVIQVTLPPNLPVLPHPDLKNIPGGQYNGYVDVHLGTPYGVSGHLLIPAVTTKPLTAPAVQFQNGFIRFAGTIKKTPDPASPNDDSKATFTIDKLEPVASSSVVAQLPRIQYAQPSGTITAQFLQQIPGGFKQLASPTDINAKLDAQQAVLVLTDEDVKQLTAPLREILQPAVSIGRSTSARFVFVLKGHASVGTQLSKEPIAGAIPIDIQLTPSAQR